MPSIFYHSDGRPTPHPTSRDAAKRLRKPRYDDGTMCPDCNACTIRHTHNGRCVHCCRLLAIDFYNAFGLGLEFEREPTDEIRAAVQAIPAHHVAPTLPLNPHDAVKWGLPFWVRLEPCNVAGHVGLITPEGECWTCAQEREPKRRTHDNSRTARSVSPRQAALAAGETWYSPDDACPKCGTHAPRRVNDGRCQGCHPPKRTPRVPLAADVIIDRENARLLGLQTYRTGQPCQRGHNAERYVSTGGCLDCLGVK